MRSYVSARAAAVALALVLGASHAAGGAPGTVSSERPVVSAPRPGLDRSAPVARRSPRPAKARPRPTPRHAVAPARPATRRTAVTRGTGRLVTVPGRSGVLGSGPLTRYRVQVEEGLGVDPAAFAGLVQQVLGDPRGWGHGGRMAFQRVSSGPVAFTVVLATPSETDRLCAPLRTGGIFSCYDSRGRAVVNARRWRDGARSYAGHLAEYRQYVISHEVGHALGHDHAYGCRSDGLAPTMMQQTKSLYGCRRNPWPYP